MGVLENVGIGIAFILILVFAVYFAIIGVTFMLGLPQLFVKYGIKLGRILEENFPRFANTKGVKTGFGLVLIFFGMAVFIGAIIIWFRFLEWLPN